MSANKKRYNPLKASPEYLSEEVQTPAEKIMDKLTTTPVVLTAENFQDISPVTQHLQQNFSKEEASSAEQELLDLLDKYYNGDRTVAKELRYKNKEQYKQLLIQKFKQWGLIYVEKKHYALSRPEKHLIRIDFYGTVNKPRPDQKSEAYIKNSTIFAEGHSRKDKKRAKAPLDTDLADNMEAQTLTEHTPYSPQDYDLNISPTWRLMRTFPRFHTIENKVRIQMAKQGLDPQILPYLNVYDYSDILYNYYQKPETQEGESVRIFLGARQAFIKDLFKKNADWFRDYFKRHNYDERYVEALIKIAQRKGVTANIDLKNSIQDYMLEYLHNHKNSFLTFTKEQVYNQDHMADILEQLENTGTPLTGEMNRFILSNETTFKNYLKRKYISSHLLNATFEALNDQEMPFYLKENLKGFALSDSEDFQQFLQSKHFSPRESQLITEKLRSKPLKGKFEIFVMEYSKQNIEKCKQFLQTDNRDENYIKYITNKLNPPLIPEYMREGIENFILSHDPASDLSKQLQQTGITHETYPLVKDYILQHRKEYSEFFKQNNILTYQELNEQYTDITNFIIKTQKIPSYIKDFAKQFILRNKTVFRYWYSNFKLRQYQSDAELKHKTILNQGLSADDFSEVTGFIKERIDIFSEFCQDHGLLLKSQEISSLFHQGNFLNPKELSKFSNTETISTLRNLLEQFIRRNGYIYRNSLVQQHIKCKETEADILLKKFTQQGITLTTMSIAHKFILNNKPLFNNDLYNGTDADNYSNDITINLKSNGANKDVQKIAKNFILHHRQDFIAFINTPHNIENYITSIAQQLEKSPEKGELYYWGLQYISQNQTDFLQYLEKEKIGTTNIESLKKQFANYTLSQNIKMICEKENTVLQFRDGYTINIPIAVHHINAVQDSFEQYHPQTAHKPKVSNSVDAGGITQDLFPILPAANYFENLSGIIDDPYHIRFFHGLDKTEKFDNWERYIGRIYPQNKDIVFFGGLAPEDQLTYDYSNDERTKRYRAHTEKMIALNAQERKKDTLAPETAFYIVTGSRQGRG